MPELQMAAIAAAAFLGEEASQVRPLGAGTANLSFFVTGRDGRAYVLKRRSPKYAGRDFAAYEAEYLARLTHSGIPAPVLLPAPDGSPFLAQGDTLWQLSPRIEGLPFSDTPGQIREAGRFLARYHDAVADFTPMHERVCPRYEHPEELRQRYRDFRGAYPAAEGCEWAGLLIDRLLDTLGDEACRGLPALHIHGDYHSFNLLFSGDAVSGIFDFDRSSLQLRLRDVADGVIFFGSLRQSPIDDRDIVSLTQSFRPAQALYRGFLDGYDSSARVPLTDDEYRLLPGFIAARFLGMRLDAMAKLPPEKRPSMLSQDVDEPRGWFSQLRSTNVHL